MSVTTSCHDGGGGIAVDPLVTAAELGVLRVALVGQPNVGKSTIFNLLTGLSQHVGNWPGKTIAHKTGLYHHNGLTLHLVDLPGTYSLTANSEEERIARDYLIQAKPDVVVAIVDAAQLERNLYLVAELLSLPQPLILGLNMLDVARQNGIQIEPHVLAAALGVPVVPLIATRNDGIQQLMDDAVALALHPDEFHPSRPAIRPEHAPVLAELTGLIAGCGPAGYPTDWLALKLLEGDAEITAIMQTALPAEKWQRVHALLLRHEDAYLDIAGGRYEWIGRMVRAAVAQPRAGAISLTDRLDRVATHPVAGLLVLLAVLGLVFWITYQIATPFANWMSDSLLTPMSEMLRAALSWAPAWVSGLLVDGLIGGAGTVVTFLPILVVFFAVLGTMEDVGYLARAAYVMDRFMHLMGLHGKSFLPLFLGFGCNVPAVLGSRIVEEKRTRLLTIMLAPLVPCTARLAVLAFLAPAFFGAALAAPVSWLLVAINLVVLALVGVVYNRVVFAGQHTAFIMEMPLYHAPNPRTVGLYVWNNTVSFLKKAGTLILIASALIWLLSNVPGGGADHSVLAFLGRGLEPIGRLLGLGDWRLITALIASFVAKENVIATLGILYGGTAGTTLAAQVAANLVPAARLAFLVVTMLFIPCLATTATMRQETGSWRWPALSIALLLVLSLGAGAITYQVFGWLSGLRG